MILSPEYFLIEGMRKTEANDIQLITGNGLRMGTLLYDKQSRFFYDATHLGFLSIYDALMSSLAPSLHYGYGAFEGIYYYTSKYGVGLMGGPDNFFRLCFSAQQIQPTFVEKLVSLSLKGASVIAGRRTVAEAYRRANCGEGGWWNATATFDPSDSLVISPNSGTMFASSTEGAQKFIDIETMVSLLNLLAFANRLVSVNGFSEVPERVESSYGRPLISVGGGLPNDSLRHLKIPALGRSTQLNMFTLPWDGKYLKPEHYETGLTVLVAPYERIGDDMPAGKNTGCYSNSKANIDASTMVREAADAQLRLGNIDEPTRQKLQKLASIGEVLAKTRNGEYVEGSAENLCILVREGDKTVAYIPPASAHPLGGTNISRFIDTLRSEGCEVRFRCLVHDELAHLESSGDLMGMLFTGTGVGIIHIREIIDLPALRTLISTIEFASEDGPREVSVRPLLEDMATLKINNGQKHSIIDKLVAAHNTRMAEEIFRPVYQIDWERVASALGLDNKDILRNDADRSLVRDGRFMSKTDDRRTVVSILQDTARLAANALNVQLRRTYGNEVGAKKALRLA